MIIHFRSLLDFDRAGKPLYRAVSVDTEFCLRLVKLVNSETRCSVSVVPVAGHTLISFALRDARALLHGGFKVKRISRG